jgi:hypothetical protein
MIGYNQRVGVGYYEFREIMEAGKLFILVITAVG